jgi:hypothetical protein
MDLVQESKLARLTKLLAEKEYHGWLVPDKWIIHKVYCNHVTGRSYEISYVTKDHINPLPFHRNIEYVGVVHI